MAEGVEILCVGTELLLGDILNGNARWIAKELATLGLPHYRQTVVGDNTQRLIAAVREASHRSRVLVTTGGLGPTPDDLTTEALARPLTPPWRNAPSSGVRLKRDCLPVVVLSRRATDDRPFCRSGQRFSRTPPGRHPE